jgi:hypothetical protein
MPNNLLQQTGHANDGFSEFNANSRMSRLLSLVDYDAVGKASVMFWFFRIPYCLVSP